MDRSSRSGLWKALADEGGVHVSGAPVTAAVAAAAIRGHWGIENRAHHVRDVTMAEDASRVRKKSGILARIRSFAVSGIDPILQCRVMWR